MNGYHYSWDWDFLHLVQLNIFPGNEVAPGYSAPDPKGSLGFLADDLARCVGASRPASDPIPSLWRGRPRVEPATANELLRDHQKLQCASHFSGHTHGVRISSWRRFYTCTDGTCGKFAGNFFVVHVTPTNFVMLERKAANSWGASFQKTLPVFNPRLDTDKDSMPDWWEKHHGLAVTDPRDAAHDPDADGQSNLAEYVAGTNPTDTLDSLEYIFHQS